MKRIVGSIILVMCMFVSSVSVAAADGRFSQEELEAVYNEIIDNYYLNDEYTDIITNVGIMYGATENGEIITFSDDVSEMRVVVSVNSKNYDEYKSMFEQKYGDIVFVESVEVTNPMDEYTIDMPEEEGIDGSAEDGGTEDAAEDNSKTPENPRMGSGQGTETTRPNGYKTGLQIAIGVGLAVMAVVVIVVSKRKKKAEKIQKEE